MFKKLAEKLKINDSKSNTARVSLPDFDAYSTGKNEYLKKISQKAVELYEKQADINHFSKLVLSDPENTDCFSRVDELLQDGVVDPFVDDKLEQLADNKKILKDLGLL